MLSSPSNKWNKYYHIIVSKPCIIHWFILTYDIVFWPCVMPPNLFYIIHSLYRNGPLTVILIPSFDILASWNCMIYMNTNPYYLSLILSMVNSLPLLILYLHLTRIFPMHVALANRIYYTLHSANRYSLINYLYMNYPKCGINGIRIRSLHIMFLNRHAHYQ